MIHPNDLRIDQATLGQKLEIQLELKELGLYTGEIDGIWGLKTDRAYADYWATHQESGSIPMMAPAPALPWWTSGTHWSLIAVVISGLLSMKGMDLNAEELAPLLTNAAIVIAGLVGLFRNAKRKNPIDPTLALPGVRWHRRLPMPSVDQQPYADPRGPFGE